MNVEDNNQHNNFTQEHKAKIFEIKKYTFLKRKRKEMVDNYHKSHPWTNEEDDQLKELLYSFTSLSWKLISTKLKERSPVQCMHHWNMNLNPAIKKGKWSKEEDDIVLAYVKENGTSWRELQAFLQGRTTKQIRERWVNYLSKDTSEFQWNRDLDKLLIEKYIVLGSTWAKISAQIPKTTENMVKNRFYSLLRACVSKNKKKHRSISEKIKKIIEELNKRYNVSAKVNEPVVKLSDFAMEDMCGDEKEDEENSIEKIVNNPYLSKKKNYSLKILIEFLPFLIEDLGINIDSLNESTSNIDHNNKDDNEDHAENEYINLFDHKDDTIDFFNTATTTHNATNTIDNTYEMNMDIDSTSTSTLSKQLNSLTTVFMHHDQQFMHLFFESFRNKALFTSSK